MPLRDDLLNPIPGENPSGEYLYYTPVYEKIKEARREDDEGPVGDWQRERKLADWNLVIKLAGEALATRTKDLQLAVWLSEAHLRKEGFGEFNKCFQLLNALLGEFWETIYPELEDGDSEFRATPLQWLGNLELQVHTVPLVRTHAAYGDLHYQESRKVGYKDDAEQDQAKLDVFNERLAEGKTSADDFDKEFHATPKSWYVTQLENLDGCLESLEALQITCEEKFADMAPGWSRLRTALEKVRQTTSILLNRKREQEPDAPVYTEAPAEEEPAEEPLYQSPSAPAARPASVEPAGAGSDPIRRIVQAAQALRRDDAYSPAPYLMLMGLRQGELRAGGDTLDESKLEPPPTEIRQRLKQAAAESNWQEVLDAAEAAIALPCGRAWLDVHRYAFQACYQLGYYYAGLQTGIRSTLRALLADYPALLEMTMLDDTPVANGETLAWLRSEVLPAAEESPAPAYLPPVADRPASAADGEPPPPDAWQLALDAARAGRARDAIDLLAREAAVERSGRARFLRRAQLAAICLETGNQRIAESILEQLAAEIESRRLEEWEPGESIAHPLALLYRCAQDRESPEARALFARLCRLDPVQAMGVR